LLFCTHDYTLVIVVLSRYCRFIVDL